MKTALRAALRDDQYERLKRAALARYEQIIQDQEWSERDEALRRFEHRAEGDYRDRTGVLESNRSRPLHKIFQLKNETLGIVRGVKRFLLARICKDLFGGEPFFFVRPEGRIDDDLAEAMQKHAGWKLRGAEYKTNLATAAKVTFPERSARSNMQNQAKVVPNFIGLGRRERDDLDDPLRNATKMSRAKGQDIVHQALWIYHPL